MAELSAALEAPLNHPCYEGHFPGNPVVPGVLLLELVVDVIGRGAPHAVSAVKFVVQSRPTIEISFHAKTGPPG